MAPIATLCQGLARILSGDLDGGDASFADAVLAEQACSRLRRAGIEDRVSCDLRDELQPGMRWDGA